MWNIQNKSHDLYLSSDCETNFQLCKNAYHVTTKHCYDKCVKHANLDELREKTRITAMPKREYGIKTTAEKTVLI